jgi:hypothetical protein
MFKSEQAEYVKEGVSWEEIEFRDNSSIFNTTTTTSFSHPPQCLLLIIFSLC